VVVICVAENEPKAIGERDIFGSPNHRGEKWIGDVRNNHSDDIGVIAPKPARQLARLVAGGLHRVENANAQRFSNTRSVVQDMGDSPK
jgi:hypothetical protein